MIMVNTTVKSLILQITSCCNQYKMKEAIHVNSFLCHLEETCMVQLLDDFREILHKNNFFIIMTYVTRS